MKQSGAITKRIFDIILSLLGLLIFSLLFIIIASIIRMTSPGPALFKQERVGRQGRLFKLIKFRTMTPDTEEMGTVTTAHDTRITSCGRVLRCLKLDELPQLWNVLIGDMSFVGPRPDVPGYADKLEGKARRILEIRPGITGPASLAFCNEESLLSQVDNPKSFNDTILWPQKVALNLAYVAQWSFWRDLGYILITVLPVLNRAFKLIPETNMGQENEGSENHV